MDWHCAHHEVKGRPLAIMGHANNGSELGKGTGMKGDFAFCATLTSSTTLLPPSMYEIARVTLLKTACQQKRLTTI